MTCVMDEDGEIIIHFDIERTVHVFGQAGSGKTILAMHAAKTWLGAGGTVLVGGGHYTEYDHLPVHITDVDSVIEYGRTADRHYRGESLLIIVDGALHASEENLTYLKERKDSEVRWLIISQSPMAVRKYDHIGFGRMMESSFRTAFGSRLDFGNGGEDDALEDIFQERKPGIAIQRGAQGEMIPQRVPYDGRRPLDGPKPPLPTFPPRLWYVNGVAGRRKP